MLKKKILIAYVPFMAIISGCQTIPNAEKIIEQHRVEEVDIEIATAQQPSTTSAKSEDVIDRLTNSAQEAELLEQQLKIIQAITRQPLIAGNETRLLYDGEQTFKAMQETMNAAKKHINLEYFIFENVQFDDKTTLQDILLKKRAEGVEVNIIYDAVGSIYTPSEFFDALKQAGVNITVYHPVELASLSDLNNRDHRKMMVVDGAVAIVGGINLSQTYQSHLGSGLSKKRAPKVLPTNADDAHWRDTDLLIKGPAVAELQTLFLSHWDQTLSINTSTFFPLLKSSGHEYIHVIGSAPTDEKPYFYPALIAAIENANQSIVMSSAYFVPTAEQKNALLNAARRGTKVDLILPGLSDSSLSINVQRSYYEDLLKAGVHIYEVDSQVLHAKTISVDGVWSVVGSSNFDYRSVSLNDEVDVIILGSKTAQQLNQKFNQDKAKATKIDQAKWQKTPLKERIKQFFSRVLKKLL